MITQQELQALAALLNRLPMTQAEALWVQGLLNKLADAGQKETPAC